MSDEPVPDGFHPTLRNRDGSPKPLGPKGKPIGRPKGAKNRPKPPEPLQEALPDASPEPLSVALDEPQNADVEIPAVEPEIACEPPPQSVESAPAVVLEIDDLKPRTLKAPAALRKPVPVVAPSAAGPVKQEPPKPLFNWLTRNR